MNRLTIALLLSLLVSCAWIVFSSRRKSNPTSATARALHTTKRRGYWSKHSAQNNPRENRASLRPRYAVYNPKWRSSWGTFNSRRAVLSLEQPEGKRG